MNLQIVKRKIVFIVSFISLIFTTIDAQARTCSHEEGTFKCVEHIRTSDGDTIVVDIPGVHNFFGEEILVRISGIDAGEIKNYKGKTKCEYEMALLAKEELTRLMDNADTIELRNIERGKYFRVVADVYVNRRSLTKYMIKRSLAVKYYGGKKQRIDWCKLKEQALEKQNLNNLM